MRRFLILVLVLSVFTISATAQDEDDFEPIFDLTETFTVEDLGFEFFYPAGWVFDTSDGIALAETQADLDALITNDPAVTAEGYTIQLTGFPVDAFGLENPTLDALAEEFVTLAGVTIDEVVELPVMARRSISIIGRTEETGRGGIITMWLEDGFVVLFSFGVPDGTADGNEGFTWGQLLGSMTPITDVEVTETLELPDFGVALEHPAEWTVITDSSGARIYELESDAANDASPDSPEGLAIGLIFGTLEDVGVDASATTDEIVEFLNFAFGFETLEVTVSEYVILGDIPGVGVAGETAEGINFQVILFIDETTERVLLYALSLPSMEALEEFENASLQVLSSMRLLEE